MEIKKEYTADGVRQHYVLSIDLHGSQLSYFLTLFKEAKKYFPDSTLEDVTIKMFAGERRARLHAITFTIDEGEIPSGFTEVSNFEFV